MVIFYPPRPITTLRVLFPWNQVPRSQSTIFYFSFHRVMEHNMFDVDHNHAFPNPTKIAVAAEWKSSVGLTMFYSSWKNYRTNFLQSLFGFAFFIQNASEYIQNVYTQVRARKNCVFFPIALHTSESAATHLVLINWAHHSIQLSMIIV